MSVTAPAYRLEQWSKLPVDGRDAPLIVALTRHYPAGTAEESRSQGCPNSGSNLEVWGELKPRTGRLVVTKAQAVLLPPKREMATPVAG